MACKVCFVQNMYFRATRNITDPNITAGTKMLEFVWLVMAERKPSGTSLSSSVDTIRPRGQGPVKGPWGEVKTTWGGLCGYCGESKELAAESQRVV